VGPTAKNSAVGFAISEIAGQWATVTKLARNAVIGLPVGVLLASEGLPDAAVRESVGVVLLNGLVVTRLAHWR